MQQSLFKVTLADYEPDEPTAHLKKIAFDATGVKYAIRRVEDGNWIPLSEWIGYNLSRLCEIATPDFLIAYDHNDTPVFASKWSDGKVFNKTDSKAELIVEITSRLQAILNILVLDKFIENPDRHFGNLIFSSGTPNLLSFDFSLLQLTRLACDADIDRPSKQTTQQSYIAVKTLANNNNITLSEDEIIIKIKGITRENINEILTSAPDYWMQQAGIDCIIDFLIKEQKKL